jgi:hypothetical protein
MSLAALVVEHRKPFHSSKFGAFGLFQVDPFTEHESLSQLAILAAMTS